MREPRHRTITTGKTTCRRILITAIVVTATILAVCPEALAAGLTIIERPMDLVSGADTVVIRWAEPHRTSLRHAARSGGGDPSNYPYIISDLIIDRPGHLAFLPGEQLSPGIHYCLLSGSAGASNEFLLLVESTSAPATISPRTSQSGNGIETVDPVFRWHAVPGVPYYHLLLSDQPFRIQENEDGELSVTGANIIWQAITAGTSLPYGAPDPSGSLPPAQTPPLVSGLRYNWLVLNNYGNHPALSSAVTAGPSGFHVDVQPPFSAPLLTEPSPEAEVTCDPISFRWSRVPEAAGYHLYLYEILESDGSSAALPVFHTATGRTEYRLPAGGRLRAGEHLWKVLAADDAGYGVLSLEGCFFYRTASATLAVHTRHDGGTSQDPSDDASLPLAEVTVERLTGPGDSRDLLTDENGYADIELPLGTYRLIGLLAGYRSAADTICLTDSGGTVTSTLTLSPNSAAVYGSTADAAGNPLPWVEVGAAPAGGGEDHSAESDLNGAFRLQLEPGTWILSAARDGYLPPESRSVILPAGRQYDLDDPAAGGPLILNPCRYHLSGQVTNPDGLPVWQAEVTIGNGPVQYTDQTDALGQYEFSIEPGTWTVNASKPGYAQADPAMATITDTDMTTNLMLIPRASLVSGWVTDGQAGLADASVTAMPLAGPSVTAATGPDGRFILSLLPGTYRLEPTAEGHLPPEPLFFTLGRGEHYHDVELPMVPADASIGGRITSDGLIPLEGARVSNGTVHTMTGADGRYRLELSAGGQHLEVSRAGFLSAWTAPILLAEGQHLSGVDLALYDHAGVLEGHVLCAGQPTGEARAVIEPAGGAKGAAGGQGLTDQAGKFVCSLSPGDYLISVRKPGLTGGEGGRSVTVRAGQRTVLEPFYLEEHLARIGGTVVSRSTPLDGALVRLESLWPEGPDYSTLSDPDGRFVLEAAAGGSYVVTASRDGYLSAADTVLATQPGDVSQLTLQLEPCQSLIAGRITDTGGDPLEESLVMAGDSSAVYRTLSEGDGTYRLPLPAGRHQLRITRPGYAGRTSTVTAPLGATLAGRDFALRPNPVTVTGEVRDALSGFVLPGVLVTAAAADTTRGGSARCDADGQFVIPDLAPGVYRLTVGPDGYEPRETTQRILVGGQLARIDLALEPYSAGLRGTVSGGGQPLAGATITVAAWGRVVGRTTSGDTGVFEIDRLPHGVMTVAAFKSGYTSPASDTVLLTPGQNDSIAVELIPNNGLICGRVSSSGDGLPAVLVTARGQDGWFASDSTGPDGRFRLDRLAGDTYTLDASAGGYLTVPVDTTAAVGAGDSVFIPFELIPCGLSVSGRVTDQDGQALPGTTVEIIGRERTRRTVTDGAGRYLLEDLSPGAAYTLTAVFFLEGYRCEPRFLELDAEDLAGADLEVVVSQGAISGRTEVEGATVTVTGPAAGMCKTVLSQPDGSYQVEVLPAGDYRVTARKFGWTSSPGVRQVTGLGAGEQRTGVNFLLTTGSISISGQVLDQDLDPVPGAPVTAICPRLTCTDTTDDQGRYHIDQLAPRQIYQVGTLLEENGYDNDQLPVEVSGDPVTVSPLRVTVHNAAIDGQILDHQGRAVAGVDVRLSPGETITTSDAGGRFIFSCLEAGGYRLEASTAGWRSETQDVEALKGRTVSADLSLRPVQGALYGRAGSEGDAVSGLLVMLSSPDMTARAETTDFGGSYAFEDLDITRSYVLTARKPGYEASRFTGIILQEGESRRLDLTPAPVSNTISGTVRYSGDGAPAPGTLVRAVDLNGITRRDTCDGLGNYCLYDLPAGPCAVTAVLGDLAGASRSLVMIPARAERIDFALAGRGSIGGTVTYRGQGRPGALVTAVDRQTGEAYPAASRSGGTFGIPGLTPGDYVIAVSIRGFETAESPGCLTLLPGTQQNLDIQLTGDDVAVLGSIRDIGDQPVAGAVVIASADGATDSTTADHCGNYALSLSPSSRCIIRTRAGGHHQAPAETVSVVRGEAMVVDFELIPRTHSIFGTVLDGGSGEAIAGAEAALTDPAGGELHVTTSAGGEYLFPAQPGVYTLGVAKDGYAGWGPREIVLPSGGFVPQDAVLNRLVTTAGLDGAVTWGDEPLPGVRIAARSFDGEAADTVWSGQDGRYLFPELPAGQDYLLQASQAGFADLSSGPVPLPAGGQTHDLHFPRGRIFWSVAGQEGQPLAGVTVHLSSAALDTAMITDAGGGCRTGEHLEGGWYQAGLTAGGDYLPVAPYEIHLGPDENRTETVALAIRHVPFPDDSAFSVGEEIPVLARVEDPGDSTELLLFYRHPGETDFSVERMTPGGKSSLTRKERPAGEGIAGSSGPVPVIYRAVIPGGETDGRLAYFIEARHLGRTYSRRSSPWELEVMDKGTLHKAVLSPPEIRLPPDLPYVFQLQTYDVQGHSLNDLMTAESISWTLVKGPGEIESHSQDPTLATFVSCAEGVAVLEATVSLEGITLRTQAHVTCQSSALGQLEIIGPALPTIASGSQAAFRYAAQDKSGRAMSIWPRWDIQPEGAGSFTRSLNGDRFFFTPHADFIGQVRILLTDSTSGQSAEYNAGGGAAVCDRGAAVYYPLAGGAPGTAIGDRQGFRLIIPDSALAAGAATHISLRAPNVPDVKRYTSRHQIHGQIYEIGSSFPMGFARPVELILPVCDQARGMRSVIGRWDGQALEWIEIGGARRTGEISAPVDHFSQFAVLSVSEPLGWSDIRLLPNPFTPHDAYALQLGFTLSSDRARKPFVTIRVYNMTGRLVRTICENEPVPKGTYPPGESFLDSRGEDITLWDGRTETGELARNGRYLIHFRADDSDGTVEKLLPVVLIK